MVSKKDFPGRLKKIKDPLEKLYYRENWDEKIFKKAIAVVGSRSMTKYGEVAVNKLVPGQILSYQKKLSEPILDRIDLHINVPFVEVEKLKFANQAKRQAESSETIRQRVVHARKIQEKRFAGDSIFANA